MVFSASRGDSRSCVGWPFGASKLRVVRRVIPAKRTPPAINEASQSRARSLTSLFGGVRLRFDEYISQRQGSLVLSGVAFQHLSFFFPVVFAHRQIDAAFARVEAHDFGRDFLP